MVVTMFIIPSVLLSHVCKGGTFPWDQMGTSHQGDYASVRSTGGFVLSEDKGMKQFYPHIPYTCEK